MQLTHTTRDQAMPRPKSDTARSLNDYAHFRIGEMTISLRSDLEEVAADFGGLYEDCCQTDTPGDPGIRIEVKREKRSFLGGKQYVICGDGEALWTTRRPNEVLPYVEWGINWRVIATRADYLQLHAATMAHDGQGVIFAAKSGAGKSTLAAGLLSRGWGYLSDEFALIHPETLRVHPFPKAVCIKSGAFNVVEGLNLPLWQRRHYVKAFKGRVGYLPPYRLGANSVGGPCPVRHVVFPRYTQGARPRLREISRADAAFRLAASALNRHVFGHRATSIVSDVVRGADCFDLECGAIDETCDVVESLIQGQRPSD